MIKKIIFIMFVMFFIMVCLEKFNDKEFVWVYVVYKNVKDIICKYLNFEEDRDLFIVIECEFK